MRKQQGSPSPRVFPRIEPRVRSVKTRSHGARRITLPGSGAAVVKCNNTALADVPCFPIEKSRARAFSKQFETVAPWRVGDGGQGYSANRSLSVESSFDRYGHTEKNTIFAALSPLIKLARENREKNIEKKKHYRTPAIDVTHGFRDVRGRPKFECCARWRVPCDACRVSIALSWCARTRLVRSLTFSPFFPLRVCCSSIAFLRSPETECRSRVRFPGETVPRRPPSRE